MSLVLLVGAGLLLRSFLRVLQADAGLPARRRRAWPSVPLPQATHGEHAKRAAVVERVVEELRSRPGVAAGGGRAAAPRRLAELVQRRGQAGAPARPAALRGHHPGHPGLLRGDGRPRARGARLRGAGPHRRPRGLHRGRDVCPHPLAGGEPARQAREVRRPRRRGPPLDGGRGPRRPRQELRRRRARRGSSSTCRSCRARRAGSRSWPAPARSPGTVASGMRQALHAVDGQLPIYAIRPLDEIVAERSARAAALRAAHRRLRDRGPRCSPRWASTGSCPTRWRSARRRSASAWRSARSGSTSSGWCCAAAPSSPSPASPSASRPPSALARLIAALLFETSTADPPTFSAVPVLLLAVALVASYLPARRAARVDPMSALRYE